MLVRLSQDERDNSWDKKGNTEVAEGWCTQEVRICLDLLCFGNNWAVFIIFLIDIFPVSFVANFARLNCLYTMNYLNVVR